MFDFSLSRCFTLEIAAVVTGAFVPTIIFLIRPPGRAEVLSCASNSVSKAYCFSEEPFLIISMHFPHFSHSLARHGLCSNSVTGGGEGFLANECAKNLLILPMPKM